MQPRRIPRQTAQDDVDTAADSPDLKTRLEEQTYLLSKARTQLVQAKVRSVEQDIEERKVYAAKIFKLICGWVIGLGLIVCFSSLSLLTRFQTPQAVILALVGSTTATVLGLFYIVAHYLFPDRTDKPRAEEHTHEHADKPS